MDNSGFGRLSAELRNRIYELAFEPITDVDGGKTEELQHPLTKACRQIRAESLTMYYENTCFNLICGPKSRNAACTWLRTMGPGACASLRTLACFSVSATHFRQIQAAVTARGGHFRATDRIDRGPFSSGDMSDADESAILTTLLEMGLHTRTMISDLGIGVAVIIRNVDERLLNG